MFRSNREKVNKIDKLEKRSVELARQIRDLNQENEYLYEENRDLRFENEELRNLLTEIADRSVTYPLDSEKIVLNKIKELVREYQSTN